MTSTDHNKALCEQVIAANAVTSRYPKVCDQVETLPLEREKLFPFGYNASMIEHGGWTLLAYRYHPGADASTKIALAQIGPAGEVITNRALSLDSKSAEDPKFFTHSGELYMSFVVSDWPAMVKSVVRYVYIFNGEIKDIVTPKIGKNDGTSTEKNWVFWDRRTVIMCLYASDPCLKTFQLEKAEVVDCYASDPPKWPYGPIRGGCIVPWDGKLLRFFHSPSDQEWFGPNKRRYFVGCCLMETEPPFAAIAISKRPILYGSEIDRVKVSQRPFHHKCNVVFPGSAIVRDGVILLPVGVNDSSIEICKLTERELNL
jgi:predicted GH43/DUF377 family glycosyl hydrolase